VLIHLITYVLFIMYIVYLQVEEGGVVHGGCRPGGLDVACGSRGIDRGESMGEEGSGRRPRRGECRGEEWEGCRERRAW
jgi:hypothetical protein